MQKKSPQGLSRGDDFHGTTDMNALENELAQLLVDSLNLEMAASDIDPQAPLYQEGLGLDSIDLLELSVVISRQYGFQIKSDDPDVTHLFSSLSALAEGVAARRTV
jgi:acyl carrier protein